MTEVKRILLVEDDANDIELTLSAFEQYNVANEVVVTRDGHEALQYLRRQGPFASRGEGHPAVVLLDLKLPKLDGLEVLQQLRADSALRMIPVVMLTSSREEQDLANSYGYGVNAYVVKPVNFTDFLEALKNVGLFWAAINEPPPGSVRPRG